MTRLSIFMISLILMIGCNQDNGSEKFSNQEAQAYQKIIADFEAPVYKWGYLNKLGQLAIEDKYDDLREFNEGIAAANINGLWGYIDQHGTTVLDHRFLTISQFSEGLGIAQDLTGKFHIYTKNFESIKDSLEYNALHKYQSGRALVSKGQRFGYLDPNGDLVIDIEYEQATDFQNGLAIVTKDGKSGLIDTDGNQQIPISLDKLWFPRSGYIRYKNDGKFGFYDARTYKKVFKDYLTATDFYQEYAVINDGNQYKLLSKNGDLESLPYALVDVGGEGKWMYASDAKFGFLNNDGSRLCLPNYDLVMRYREGRAGFAINDVWGYLDETGQISIPPKYPLVWDFVGGYARMIGSTGFGFIDKDGVDVMPSAYMEVRDFSEGLARIQVYR